MALNRLQIEKSIINELKKEICNDKVTFKGVKNDGSHHYYTFQFDFLDVYYVLTIRFFKSNYLKYDADVNIYSKEINALIKTISHNTQLRRDKHGNDEIETSEFSILIFRLDTYLHPDNAINVATSYKWNQMKSLSFYIDGKKMNKPFYEDVEVNEERITEVVNEIKVNFIDTIQNKIYPKADSIESIYTILNGNIISEDIPVLSVCYPYSQQLTMGFILVNYLNKPNKKELSEKYLKVVNNYGEDRYGYLALFYQAASYFG